MPRTAREFFQWLAKHEGDTTLQEISAALTRKNSKWQKVLSQLDRSSQYLLDEDQYTEPKKEVAVTVNLPKSVLLFYDGGNSDLRGYVMLLTQSDAVAVVQVESLVSKFGDSKFIRFMSTLFSAIRPFKGRSAAEFEQVWLQAVNSTDRLNRPADSSRRWRVFDSKSASTLKICGVDVPYVEVDEGQIDFVLSYRWARPQPYGGGAVDVSVLSRLPEGRVWVDWLTHLNEPAKVRYTLENMGSVYATLPVWHHNVLQDAAEDKVFTRGWTLQEQTVLGVAKECVLRADLSRLLKLISPNAEIKPVGMSLASCKAAAELVATMLTRKNTVEALMESSVRAGARALTNESDRSNATYALLSSMMGRRPLAEVAQAVYKRVGYAAFCHRDPGVCNPTGLFRKDWKAHLERIHHDVIPGPTSKVLGKLINPFTQGVKVWPDKGYNHDMASDAWKLYALFIAQQGGITNESVWACYVPKAARERDPESWQQPHYAAIKTMACIMDDEGGIAIFSLTSAPFKTFVSQMTGALL